MRHAESRGCGSLPQPAMPNLSGLGQRRSANQPAAEAPDDTRAACSTRCLTGIAATRALSAIPSEPAPGQRIPGKRITGERITSERTPCGVLGERSP
jgi:hypothetical protein